MEPFNMLYGSVPKASLNVFQLHFDEIRIEFLILHLHLSRYACRSLGTGAPRWQSCDATSAV